MSELIHKDEILNIAAIKARTRALGPGLRTAIWFQGCPFQCPGCISPAWIEKKNAYLIRPEILVNSNLNDQEISGITISGGEPFYQPSGLFDLLKLTKIKRPDINVIIFTGFLIEHLFRLPEETKIGEILSLVDVLIDGPYREMDNHNIGLRGSSNQRIHRLTDRLAMFDFKSMPRINEIYLENGTIQLSGVPDRSLSMLIRDRTYQEKEGRHVRP